MKVLISNPSKQHSPHLVIAFKNKSIKVIFATSFWYKNNFFFNYSSNFNKNIKRQFEKKRNGNISDNEVILNFFALLISIILRVFKNEELKSYINDRIHDYWVSYKIKKQKPNIFIGAEKSSLKSFKVCKQLGGLIILDLASVHVKLIETLREKFPEYKKTTGNKFLFNKIMALKLKEYLMADIIFVLSQFARTSLLKQGISPSKVIVMNLGFDPNIFFSKRKYSSSLSLNLVYVGNATKRKGLHLLISILKDFENFIPINLTIIGPTGDAIPMLSGNSNIKYYNFLNHFEIVEILHRSDVFVFPSFMDSWGMVVIEAMACGLPVILTENTGAKDILTKECGFIIPVNDQQALKEKIEYFYNNRTEIERMGKNAAEVVQKYTWDNYYKQVNEFIETIKV